MVAASELHPKHYPDTEAGRIAKGLALRGSRVALGQLLYRPGGFGNVSPDYNTYVNCASFRALPGQRFRKTREHYGALHALMIDDVGPKVSPAVALSLLPPPTARIETSEGNEQWWYKLASPIPDYDTAKRVVEAMVRLVPNDGAGPSRWGRLPVGSNTKQQPPWRHRLVSFEPVAYSVKELGLVVAPPYRGLAPKALPGAGAVAEWLGAKGYVKAEQHNMLTLVCPWSCVYLPGGHDDDNGTHYYKPSEGYPSGGFRCHHAKCNGRTVRDLIQYCLDVARAEVSHG